MMNIYTQLKQCKNLDDFYATLDTSNDKNVFNHLKTELDAVELYEDLVLEIESVKCREIANEILNDLSNIQNILSDYLLLNIIEVSIRTLNEKLKSLRNCNNNIDERIRVLEKNPPKCSKCEQSLIVREGKGTYFWGCRDFPDCWGKRYFTTEQNEWIYKGIEMSINSDSPTTGEGVAIEEKTKIEEYKELIQLLADGINPFTGEVFEHTHVCQNANVVRALLASIKALEKECNRSKRKKALPKNAGKGWMEDDDGKLLKMFNEGIQIKELSDIFERTPGSIRSRLLNMGILTEKDL